MRQGLSNDVIYEKIDEVQTNFFENVLRKLGNKNIYIFRPKNEVKVVKRSKNFKNVIFSEILYKKV